MTDSPSPTPAAPAPTSLAVSCVRALMERHGLPKYRQSAWLAEAIGLSYARHTLYPFGNAGPRREIVQPMQTEQPPQHARQGV